ncbi:hypothetical protein [Faecalibaculum rodentium]|uniref:hypothetical protein n=1 Tax=Faecalibaculum rodentium TaxID=1702221 RepID=UPI0027302561|nr:hypothetical protein [Faecalibaculum rodentium]
MKKVKNANGTVILRDDYDVGFSGTLRSGFVVDSTNKVVGINIIPTDPNGPDIVQIALGYGENPYLAGFTCTDGKWTGLGKAFLS